MSSEKRDDNRPVPDSLNSRSTGIPKTVEAMPDPAVVQSAVALDYAPGPLQPVYSVGSLRYTKAALVLVFFWLLFGDFAMSMRDRSVGPTIQLFLKTIQVSDTTMALLVSSLPQFLGMVLVPIVSSKSDRFRSRWGRRIPFLLVPTPIAAMAMIGIAYTPHIGTWLHHAWTGTPFVMGELATSPAHDVIVSVFAIFWTLFEVAIIISGAVLPALINDVVPRRFLGRFYGLFRAISLIDGMIFNYLLLQYAQTHFTAIFSGIGILFGAGFVLMCLNVKEGEYPPPPVDTRGKGEWKQDTIAGFSRFPDFTPLFSQGFFARVAHLLFCVLGGPLWRLFWAMLPPRVKLYFRECFSQPHYLWIFAALTFGMITFNPINLFSILYATQLSMDMKFYGSLIAASYFCSLCLAFPLGWLVDKFHPLRVAMVTLFIYAVSCIYGAFFIVDARSFGIALVAHTVLSGSYFTAAASLGQALLPRSKFATYASAGALVTALATMLIGPTMGKILDLTHHQYRLTYLAGLILSTITLCLMGMVLHRFMRMGGPRGYVAPGDTFEESHHDSPAAIFARH